jgi:hypothetical protein
MVKYIKFTKDKLQVQRFNPAAGLDLRFMVGVDFRRSPEELSDSGLTFGSKLLN